MAFRGGWLVAWPAEWWFAGRAGCRAPSTTVRTQDVDDQIARLTGEKHCWGDTYRSNQPSTSNHNTGNAHDCTISNAAENHAMIDSLGDVRKVIMQANLDGLQRLYEALNVEIVYNATVRMLDASIRTVARDKPVSEGRLALLARIA